MQRAELRNKKTRHTFLRRLRLQLPRPPATATMAPLEPHVFGLLAHVRPSSRFYQLTADLLNRQSDACLGIVLEQVAKRHEQLRRMLDTAVVERLVNVINDHYSNRFCSVSLV